MPKLTTLLGWGTAAGAGKKLAGRKKKLEEQERLALGGKKKPKGTFKPKGKR